MIHLIFLFFPAVFHLFPVFFFCLHLDAARSCTQIWLWFPGTWGEVLWHLILYQYLMCMISAVFWALVSIYTSIMTEWQRIIGSVTALHTPAEPGYVFVLVTGSSISAGLMVTRWRLLRTLSVLTQSIECVTGCNAVQFSATQQEEEIHMISI